MWKFLPLSILLVACAGGTASGGSTVAGGEVLVNGVDFGERARNAWKLARSAELSAAGGEFVAKVGSKVAIDGPVSGLPEGVATVDITQLPVDALVATEDGPLADAIRAADAKVLIVHRALAASFDRDRHLLSRVYHHDYLDRFQLVRVEKGLLVYLVVDSGLRLDANVADAATRWLRDALTGKQPAPFPPLKPERSNWQLLTTIRGKGQELAISLSEGNTLDVALRETVNDLEVMHRRNREIVGFPRLTMHMDTLVIELRRLKERAFVVPRDEATLASLWELGIDGAIVLNRETKKSAVWPGATAVGRGITKADEFLRGMARDFRWETPRPWEADDVSLEIIRTIDYREVPGRGVVPMYRGTVPVPLEAVNIDTVKSSIVYAGEWYLQNLQPNGQVTYKMWPEENRYSNEYNHVRHELATWNLWQAWKLDPRPEFLEGAIRAQDWTLLSLVERDASNLEPWERELVEKSPYKDEILKDGMAYLTYGGNTKLGSVVVGLYGMIDVARSTGDHSKDDLMRKFARYVMFSQLPEGHFRPYHVPPGHPYEKAVNDIVPGEAALALVYLAEYFNDPAYLDVLPKFFEYYKPWFKSRADKKNPNAPWPAYTYDNDTRLELVQFGPWTVMAANAYTRNRPAASDVVDFGLEVGRWMIESYEYTSERAPFPDYVGGYYKFEGELPAMQAFCYGEGTAAAYQMALRARPEQAAFFEKATRETVRFGLQTQHDRMDTLYFSRGEEVEGGIKYALNEPKVRIDYVYHGQSAMWQWLQSAMVDPNLAASAKATPAEALKLILSLQDMPFFRPEGAPVRTSSARGEITLEGAAPGGAPPTVLLPVAARPAPATPTPVSPDEDGGE